MKLSLLLVLLSALPLIAAEPLRVDLMDADILIRRLTEFPIENAERQAQAVKLFESVNCPKIEMVPLGKKDVPANVVCTFPGETGRTILVSAHFDKVKDGEGKIDNGSGTIMLHGLARALRELPRRHTFRFVAFAEEEKGLLGSAALVKKGIEGLPGKEFLATISSVVNIDSVGSGTTAIALDQSDREIANILYQTAHLLKLEIRLINVSSVGHSDYASFRTKQIRGVEVHSLDNNTFPILHSKRDNMTALQAKEYAETYRLLAFFLAQLDRVLDN